MDNPLPTKRISARRIRRWKESTFCDSRDELVIEEPLELRVASDQLAVMMRTPGHDVELARGLLHAEGLVRTGDPSVLIVVEGANVIRFDIDDRLLQNRWSQRRMVGSSACGVCGAAALAVLEEYVSPVLSDLSWTPEMICAAPNGLREKQELFERCGSLHGAALFNELGELVACREDVGRHNAVDKLIGWAIEESILPLSRYVLVVSSRLSYEIVQKAIAAGIPMIVAVSGPSSLAVDLAERWRVTLAGFVRDDGFNIYSHASRIRDHL